MRRQPRPARRIERLAAVLQVDELAGDCEVRQRRFLADEIGAFAELPVEVVEVLRQHLFQRLAHRLFVAPLAGARLDDTVAEHAEGGIRGDLVVGVFFQPAHPRAFLRGVAEQGDAVRMAVVEVLADDAGVGEDEVTVLQGGNPAERIEFEIPGGRGEGHDEFELVVEALFQQGQSDLTHEGGQRNAIQDEAHSIPPLARSARAHS